MARTIKKDTVTELRMLLRGAEAQIAALRQRVRQLTEPDIRPRAQIDSPPPRPPEPDMSEAYKLGDMLRPNPSGSVTLLRDTGTILRFRAITTWEPQELSSEVRQLVEADRPRIVSRRRAVSFAEAMKMMEMPRIGCGT